MYLVPEGHWVDGVLCSQWDTAKQDEEEDDVGEGCSIDNAMAEFAEPEQRNQKKP